MSHSRTVAIQLLHHALETKTPPEFLPVAELTNKPVSEEDERFARAMVLLAFRHLGQLDAAIAHYLKKPLAPSKRWVQNALRIGAVQIYCSDMPAHAAVNETVNAVKKSKYKALFGMVNAVLKNLATNASKHPLSDYPSVANIPNWLRPKLQAQYSEPLLAEMASIAAKRPGHDLNVSLEPAVDASVDPLLLRLNPSHLRLQDHTELSAVLSEHPSWFVQDIAASYPVQMLGDIADKKVIEIGAAPGGKTMQLLAKKADVLALDRSASRLERLEENLSQRNLQAQVKAVDALTYQPEFTPDIVVLDAPCSATGTWRKHPEVLHLLDEAEIDALVLLQRELITTSLGWLKPGGKLLYCVCSLLAAEGEEQADWALGQYENIKLVDTKTDQIIESAFTENGTLRTHLAMMKEAGGMDGFYAVVFEKTA